MKDKNQFQDDVRHNPVIRDLSLPKLIQLTKISKTLAFSLRHHNVQFSEVRGLEIEDKRRTRGWIVWWEHPKRHLHGCKLDAKILSFWLDPTLRSHFGFEKDMFGYVLEDNPKCAIDVNEWNDYVVPQLKKLKFHEYEPGFWISY